MFGRFGEVPKSQEVPSEEQKLPGVQPDVVWSYTPTCLTRLTNENTLSMEWDNGNAYTATTGGSKDYIPAHMKMHLNEQMTKYAFWSDYEAMVAGKIQPSLAWIMCVMRQTALSLGKVKLSLSESVFIKEEGIILEHKVDPEFIALLKAQPLAVDAIIQQSFSIFCLNALSLIGRGHHYSEDDKMWERLVAATRLDEHFSALKINNWEKVIFHDLFHPFDMDWQTSLLTNKELGLAKKCHGVVTKRWNVVPAGCTSVQLFLAASEIVKFKNKKLFGALQGAIQYANAVLATIQARPLDYCIHLPRVNTTDNVAKVQKFEPLVAFVSGYLKGIQAGKVTVLQAKSVGNINQRHPAYYTLGVQSATAFAAEDADPDVIINSLMALTQDLRTNGIKTDNNNE